ncbi:MAG: Jag N-terminal domain-containing protein, partial [Spirochaetaceae bacterium]|nr:Jag N-terminal domain-containing protein [Spirochaetaceae bacterium]
MVTLEKIREDLRKELQKDSDLNFVEVRADTLEEALADAGVQLDANTKNLEYEVQEKGSAGMFGLAKKPWKIRVYQTAEAIEKKKKQMAQATGGVSAEGVAEEENKIVDKDGVFFVHHFGSDIYLKVVLPVGSGRPVEVGEVIAAAQRSDTLSIEEENIKKFVKEGTNDKYE